MFFGVIVYWSYGLEVFIMVLVDEWYLLWESNGGSWKILGFDICLF